MSAISIPKRVKTSDNVLFQQIANECVLLNMETEQYFGLDAVGARVWQIITEDGDTDKVLATLKMEYDVDEANLLRDLSSLFSEMEQEKLIVVEK